ncbi:efflux RND transporter periplasmic adaptor subunit [Actomonas aquatica]|uniref:Efflux RND transporter periplasmic adaptor subunit n=1 Tax=Actomonas aquatica TaxID=2866162 RepID=A0ABZ1C777_9BACT|nr:efflux RND transporter periplasmic adaptor subunit [Opitutus sp. WL0086]WRQ87273.1 efflux RND transporter periplasmic adaptor subunit [Opitutus sp. WL0086]
MTQFAICASALLLLSACSDQPKAARGMASAPPVEATQARRGSLPLVERLSGTIRADNQVVLYPEVSGRIDEVLVDDGDHVNVGDILVRINDDQVREQVRQAEAGHRISAARLRQARARLAEAAAQANRSQALNERNLVSDLEYETLAAQRDSAAADVELAEAELEQASANLAERRDLLARTLVRAPVSGLVGARRAEIGMQVSTSTALFTIGDLSSLHVRVNLTDAMIGYIKIGQPAKLVVSDLLQGTEPLNGSVTRISPFLNEITRSTEAEIHINQTDTRLLPGMFLAVDIHYGESRQATLVPTSSLFTDPNTGREGVFVLTPETPFDPAAAREQTDSLSSPVAVTFRNLNIVARGANEVAVANLDSADWIVTLGQDLLSSNGRSAARVRPVTWDHVLELQSLNREDLLNEVLDETTATDS